MNYDTLKQSVQKLIKFYTTAEFAEELSAAKKTFFDNAGTVDENNPNFNLRMNQFYEWYFFTRPLNSYMKVPLEVCDQHRALRLDVQDIEAIKILLQSQRHSMFEFIKGKNGIITAKDLFLNKKIEIQQGNLVFGFDTKEYFQARTITLEGKYYFLDSFCFHPESSQKFILAEVKKIQEDADLNHENFLLRLNKMRYKFEQYKHVKPDQIYANENKLGL